MCVCVCLQLNFIWCLLLSTRQHKVPHSRSSEVMGQRKVRELGRWKSPAESREYHLVTCSGRTKPPKAKLPEAVLLFDLAVCACMSRLHKLCSQWANICKYLDDEMATVLSAAGRICSTWAICCVPLMC